MVQDRTAATSQPQGEQHVVEALRQTLCPGLRKEGDVKRVWLRIFPRFYCSQHCLSQNGCVRKFPAIQDSTLRGSTIRCATQPCTKEHACANIGAQQQLSGKFQGVCKCEKLLGLVKNTIFWVKKSRGCEKPLVPGKKLYYV